MTSRKKASFDLPPGMVDGIDRFISGKPELGFERSEFIKAAVRGVFDVLGRG